MLYLVTSIASNGTVAASIHDAIDEQYAATAYGLDEADVYVCDLSIMTAYRKGLAVTCDKVAAEDTTAASAAVSPIPSLDSRGATSAPGSAS